MFVTNNPLPFQVRKDSTASLSMILAAAIDISLRARVAHWNVFGSNFLPLHELFEEIYEAATSQADDIAERCSQLGAVVEGNADFVAGKSPLLEGLKNSKSQTAPAEEIANCLSAYSKILSKNFVSFTERGDHGSADMLIGFNREVDKLLWKLDRTLAS